MPVRKLVHCDRSDTTFGGASCVHEQHIRVLKPGRFTFRQRLIHIGTCNFVNGLEVTQPSKRRNDKFVPSALPYGIRQGSVSQHLPHKPDPEWQIGPCVLPKCRFTETSLNVNKIAKRRSRGALRAPSDSNFNVFV